jgi:hypothetical protein
MEIIWLTKLLLSHLLTDFLLQGKKWIEHRNKNHFFSGYLYLHTLITALFAWALIGWDYWIVACIIFITHTLIDGWKSYQKNEAKYFLYDQVLHLLVIVGCWWFTFYELSDIKLNWEHLNTNQSFWILLAGFFFLTLPSGYLIGHLTKKWREGLDKSESLANAGNWIGIIERTLVLILVLQNQYDAIGLLVAAKGIVRFNEKERTEQKTEYLLIGTLISIGLAIITGLTLAHLT